MDSRKDFSLVLGGPLYQIWLRTRLARPPLELLIRRILVFLSITWLPLIPLTYLSGHSLTVGKVPFLFDIATHVRFLIALPLLILAELIVHERLYPLVSQFLTRDVISPDERDSFDAILNSTLKLRNSVVMEVIFILLIYTVGHWLWIRNTPFHLGTWYTESVNGKISLNLAGHWFVYVSIPIFQFLLLRWYYRLGLWYRLLWKISRLKLRLFCTHPDYAGGIGFLGLTIFAFAPILLAHSFLISGYIVNHLWHGNAVLMSFQSQIAFSVITLLAIPMIPLFFFTPQLSEAKRKGRSELGHFAIHYVQDFDQKWIQSKAREKKSPLGSSDIQSLADLSNSYQVTSRMRIIPIGKETVIKLAILLLLPIAPLMLTMVSLDQLMKKFFGVLF